MKKYLIHNFKKIEDNVYLFYIIHSRTIHIAIYSARLIYFIFILLVDIMGNMFSLILADPNLLNNLYLMDYSGLLPLGYSEDTWGGSGPSTYNDILKDTNHKIGGISNMEGNGNGNSNSDILPYGNNYGGNNIGGNNSGGNQIISINGGRQAIINNGASSSQESLNRGGTQTIANTGKTGNTGNTGNSWDTSQNNNSQHEIVREGSLTPTPDGINTKGRPTDWVGLAGNDHYTDIGEYYYNKGCKMADKSLESKEG